MAMLCYYKNPQPDIHAGKNLVNMCMVGMQALHACSEPDMVRFSLRVGVRLEAKLYTRV